MKNCITSLTLLLTLIATANSYAGIINIMPTDSQHSSIVGDNAWLLEDTFSNGIDYFTLNVDAPGALNIDVKSLVSMGVSVYAGEISNDVGIPFSNNANFTDLFTELVFVGGTNALLPGFLGGASLQSISLATEGAYTIAVGGNEGFFDTFSSFNYTLNTSFVTAKVSEPSILFCFFFGIVGLLSIKRIHS